MEMLSIEKELTGKFLSGKRYHDWKIQRMVQKR